MCHECIQFIVYPQCGVTIVKVSVFRYLCGMFGYLKLDIICFPQKNTEDEIREHVFSYIIHLQSQVTAAAAFSFLCSKHFLHFCFVLL